MLLGSIHFHMQAFLTACARFVGVGSQSQIDLCINYEGRSVMVCTNHVGIESAIIMRIEIEARSRKGKRVTSEAQWANIICIV